MKKLFKILKRIVKSYTPLSEKALILLGYSKFNESCSYLLPPTPAHGSTYRIELQATIFESKGKGLSPVEGTEEWRAYLPYDILPTIRRFKTLGELNYFHKGMCGAWLF